MSTLVADSADGAAETAQSETPEAPGDGGTPLPAPPGPAPVELSCAKCGAALAPGQDWCLQCGAAAPGSAGAPPWRGLAAIAIATTVLVLGAAAAGWAALSKHARHAPVHITTVAQVTPPAATQPSVTTPPQTFSTPTPPPAVKTPTIPLKAVTAPTPPPLTTPKTTTTGKETAGGTGSGTGSGSGTGEKQVEPLLLDTNAASTYNPYNYPTTWFGDPSLTIDGDTSTGWSAQVNPATAPKLAEGLLIDLKSAQKLASAKLVTTTPGMVVQLYGSTATTAPTSITDPSWVPLSHSLKVKKRHAQLKLLKPKRAFRFVVLWISAAPASAVGTAEAPGHVTVNEIELFPPA